MLDYPFAQVVMPPPRVFKLIAFVAEVRRAQADVLRKETSVKTRWFVPPGAGNRR